MNQELIDKIALLKEELRELIDNAEVEKRSLSNDEKVLFENKEKQIKDLQKEIEDTNKRSIEIIENTNKTDKNNMKKIAILGASEPHLPLFLKAKEMGLETYCFAWNQGAYCKDYADHYYDISITDKEQIAQV